MNFKRASTVLIETYWNVKNGVSSDSDCCTICINRNILECKDAS